MDGFYPGPGSDHRSRHELNTEFFLLVRPVFQDMEVSVGNALATCFEALDERLRPKRDFPKPAHWASYYSEGGESPCGPTDQEEAHLRRTLEKLYETIDKIKQIGRERYPGTDWFGDDYFEPGSFSA